MGIYKQIQCSDRLPDKEGTYITNEGERIFMPHYLDGWFWGDNNKNITYWLEPIEVTINSEKILSKEERKQALLCQDNNQLADIFRYFKLLYDALEVSDLQVVELRQRLIDTKALHKEYIEQLEKQILKDADEKYNLALLKLLPNIGNIEHKEMCIKTGLYQEDNLIQALKIASYGNSK